MASNLLILTLIFFISSTATTNPSSLSSSHVSHALKKTGHKMINELNLHPNRVVNILKSNTGSYDDELKVSESGLAEKRLSLSVLGDSGATVADLAQHAGYFRLQHTIDARYVDLFFGL
ncbi:hypothetical protein HanLR1_Chr14g0545201 [Helianthus annuus]|nr:hypothetical protein HanLR1_Chr14g0545201 [Helianthus annuus]